MNAKKFVKSILVYILDTALVLILVLLAYFMVFSTVTARPSEVKRIIDESGVYQKITPVLYDKFAQEGMNENQGVQSQTLPLENEAVKSAALSVFSPDYIKQQLETVIDGTYQWLDGTTTEPSFTIDLADAKNRLAEQIANQAATRAETLPVCTAQQLREVRDTNLLSLPCRPLGANIAALKTEFINSVNSDENFLKNTTISPATIKDERGNKVFQDYQNVPDTFQTLKKLPYILGALAILISTGIVLLNENRREGLKKLVKFFVIGGVFVILIPLGISSIIDSLLNEQSGDTVIRELLVPLAKKFIDTADRVYYTFGVIYLLIAGVMFLVYKKLQPPTEKSEVEKA